MLKALLHIVATAGGLLLIAHYIPGIDISSLTTAVIIAVLWGVIGLTVRPVLGLLTLPINILTLGLFSFVLNALLFWVLSIFVPGFTVEGFIPALEGSLILSIISGVINIIL
jgi:putative membrane protein